MARTSRRLGEKSKVETEEVQEEIKEAPKKLKADKKSKPSKKSKVETKEEEIVDEASTEPEVGKNSPERVDEKTEEDKGDMFRIVTWNIAGIDSNSRK